MTSLAEQRERQKRWRLAPGASPAIVRLCEQLVENEFLPPAEHRAAQDRMLGDVVRFAVAATPYHAQLFARLGLRPSDVAAVDHLPRLPVLTRRDLIDQEAALRATHLPPGQQVFGVFSSSGTTGRPTRVVQTVMSNGMFTLFMHRRCRWGDFDPSQTLAEIRAPNLLPPRPDGTRCANDELLRLPRWRYVGRFFQTGPYIAFTLANPIERQIAWLREHRPGYLLTYPGSLEELAFACVDRPPCDSLRAVVSVAAQLTAPMRRRIEQTFGVPTHEGYGLNEIGFVATRCEGDRFHVNREHCIVEIVDDEGRPCPVGQPGRIVITALQNLAMPLIRYDTDDAAQWADGPCPCGRTLPSFVGLSGRMRRYAVLPAGTRPRFNALADALEQAPPQLLAHLRRYQVHQHRDGRFELRLATSEPIPQPLITLLHDEWKRNAVADAPALEIVRVDDIPLGPGGKRLDFSSDYFADAREGEAPAEPQ